MRVLSLRPGHEAEDTESGREILAATIADPATTVMILRGTEPEVAHFADRASGRTRPFPWRELVWVTDPALFPPDREDALFHDHPEACAVVLDFEDRPAAWLTPAASRRQIERAYLTAGKP